LTEREAGTARGREGGGERETDRQTDKTKFIGAILQTSSWTHGK